MLSDIMLPNFFVIGAAKAATTSFHAYRGEHPDIHMSSIKEPSFFALPTRCAPTRRASCARRTSSSAPTPTSSPRSSVVHNAAHEKQQRSRALLALRPAPGRCAFDRMPATVREPVVTAARRLLSKPLERPEVREDLRERLRRLYDPEVERLRALTGKPFATWTV